MTYKLTSGREIDTSCPFSYICWANQYCEQECPPTLLDALREAALMEHNLKLTPHTDQDIKEVCPICRRYK